MDIRAQGKRTAAGLTATLGIVAFAATGIGSLALRGTTPSRHTAGASAAHRESATTSEAGQQGAVDQGGAGPSHATSSGS